MFTRHLFTFLSFLSCIVGFVRGNYVMNQNGVTWDPSCFGPKSVAIKAAWEGALELADSAWNRFNTKTRPLVERGALDLAAQQYINKNDPAYVQMFALDWSPEGVKKIRQVLSNFKQRANAAPGESGRPDWDESWLTMVCPQYGQQYCEDEDELVTTVNIPKGKEWDGTTMAFCPDFFARFDSFSGLKAAAGRPVPQVGQIDDQHEKVHSLFMDPKYRGADASRMYHEMTHIWWIGPTNLDVKRNVGSEETYGFVECAELAANDGCVVHNEQDVVWNADSYAWYAEYGYWAERGLDTWPEEDKPVKLEIRPQ